MQNVKKHKWLLIGTFLLTLIILASCAPVATTPTEAPAISEPEQVEADLMLRFTYSTNVPPSWIIDPKKTSTRVHFTKNDRGAWNIQSVPSHIKDYGPLFGQTITPIKFSGSCQINTYGNNSDGLPVSELEPLYGCLFSSESFATTEIDIAKCTMVIDELFCNLSGNNINLEYRYNLKESSFVFIYHDEYKDVYRLWITQSLTKLGFSKNSVDKQFPLFPEAGTPYQVNK